MSITKQQVQDCLKQISLPGSDKDIVSGGLVSDIFIDGAKVIFSLTVPAEKARELEPVREAAQAAVMALDGVDSAMVALTAERSPGSEPAGGGGPDHGHRQAAPGSPAGLPAQAPVEGVKKIIAVASGKGGVGKSTTTVNLALAMAERGLKVGILDADIYGPSMSRLLAISGRPEANDDETLLKPMQAYGLQVMSMAFLVEEDTPVIWRGPMVIKALTQMLRDVAWNDLDLLVVDMPPGTGDAQLTMAQQVPLAGAVIVSTPQDLALIDARKGLSMFEKVNVPILGIVENMSTFVCPKCGEVSNIFGHGGAKSEAETKDVEFLGDIPLHMDIRETSDSGKPVMVSSPDGPHANAFRVIAGNVARQLEL
ncbi:MAG: iron-sulfur cluster carrier protein ApbC [Hyphomicrobiales bacterium]|nr:iron-sulfur cluster carrier protein ApbC [Hyphomicrobiales bacterium]